MKAKYSCCKDKDLSGFYCIVCFGVFHPSCLDRRKNVVKLGSHKIYCSGSCQEKHMDGELEAGNLREDIQGLKEEIEGREKYIQRLQRQSRDFEDEVLHTEQKYIDKLKELNDTIQRRNKELEEFRSKISILEKEVDTMGSLKTKLEGDIRDLNNINKDMISTIKTLEVEKDSYQKEVKLLRVAWDQNKSQYRSKNVAKRSVGGNAVLKAACTRDDRPKLLLVTGAIGRDLVHFLRARSGNSYHVQAFLKPNSSNQELIDTAVRNSIGFSKKDVVIICPFSAVNQLIDDFLLKLGHTNALILTTPFGRRARENCFIYESNLSLYKSLHFRGFGLTGILDCNSVLHQGGTSWYSGRGKRLIAGAIWRHLNDRLLVQLTTAPGKLTATPATISGDFLDPCISPVIQT